MNPHVFLQIDPDPHKICVSLMRIQGDKIVQNRPKSGFVLVLNIGNIFKKQENFQTVNPVGWSIRQKIRKILRGEVG